MFSFQGVATDFALVDMISDKLRGEMMDLQHGSQFIKRCNIQASTGESFRYPGSIQKHVGLGADDSSKQFCAYEELALLHLNENICR